MPGVCEGAGRSAAGGDATGVSCAAGGAFGDVACARVAHGAGGRCGEWWRWRRFVADAGWSAADFGADVAVGWGRGAAALSLYSSWEARKMQQDVAEMNQHAAAELKARQQLEDELLVAKHEAIILTDPASREDHDHAERQGHAKGRSHVACEAGHLFDGAADADAEE